MQEKYLYSLQPGVIRHIIMVAIVWWCTLVEIGVAEMQHHKHQRKHFWKLSVNNLMFWFAKNKKANLWKYVFLQTEITLGLVMS